MSFFGKWSFRRSSMKEPKPEPVPPAIEWQTRNPSSDSEPAPCKDRCDLAQHDINSARTPAKMPRQAGNSAHTVCLSVNHLKDLFLHRAADCVARRLKQVSVKMARLRR
eukprot:scaffold171563_cov31-Tisochrysis_lutea.AAC.5